MNSKRSRKAWALLIVDGVLSGTYSAVRFRSTLLLYSYDVYYNKMKFYKSDSETLLTISFLSVPVTLLLMGYFSYQLFKYTDLKGSISVYHTKYPTDHSQFEKSARNWNQDTFKYMIEQSADTAEYLSSLLFSDSINRYEGPYTEVAASMNKEYKLERERLRVERKRLSGEWEEYLNISSGLMLYQEHLKDETELQEMNTHRKLRHVLLFPMIISSLLSLYWIIWLFRRQNN